MSSANHRSFDQVSTVVEGTRARIIAGDYERGARLPTETQLQQKWGVSRPVVREAMKILSSQGLVRIEQGRGTFVAENDGTPLRQQLEWTLLRDENSSEQPDQWDALLDVRYALEMRAVERAAEQSEEAQWAQMAASIARMRAHPANASACGEDDLEFHTALARATCNPLYPALIGSLHDLLRRYLKLSHHGRENALNTARQHEEILDSVRNGDPARATAAMRAHLQSTQDDLELARAKGLLETKKKSSPAVESLT